MKIHRYFLIFLCFLPLLILRDYTPNNELKYLSIADEALKNGHFFTFWNHGEAYADKPPLYFWLIMLGKWLLGVHSMFFLSLFSLIPAFLILYIMDRWVENELSLALRQTGQLMLLTCGLFLGAAIVLRMDMLMSLFIILALYTFYKQYIHPTYKHNPLILPMYIFGAVFTKGPVGILIPLLSIPCFLLWKKQLKDFGKYLGYKQFGILIGLCVLWFMAVYLEGGKDYLNNLLFHQTINRAVDSFHHKEPFWYYLKTIWYSLAPWVLFYIIVIVLGIKQRLMTNDINRFFISIILTTFIALSISSSKLDIYLLPIFPFIAYLSLLLISKIHRKSIRITVAIPAFLLLFTFPALFLTISYSGLHVLKNAFLLIAGGVLSLSALASLILLYKKGLLPSINTLAIGLLLTIFTGSFALPDLNKYLGFQEISRKAETIAQKNGINYYYYYKIRSGENLDVYLHQNIKPTNIEEIPKLVQQQNFILFIRNKDLRKEAQLQSITQNKNTYPIGEYSIIVF